MRLDSTTRIVVLAVLVALSAAALGLLLVRPLFSSTPVAEGVGVLPSSVVRVSWTDWSRVSAEADGGALDAESSAQDVEAFLDRAFDLDLAGTSALVTSFPGLQENFGITPAEAEWEVYGQADDGSVALLRFGDDVDLAEVEGRLEELGYEPPSDGSGQGGTWVGEVDQIAGLPGPLTQLQENLAVLEDEGILVMADDPAFVEQAVAAVRGEDEQLAQVEGVEAMLDELEDPVTATVWVGDYACEELAMSQADRSDVEEADRLVDEAGGVNPLTGLAFAESPDEGLQFVFGFDSDEDASQDLQPRTDLASGAAPGQGGTFPERFEITSSSAEGRLVTMRAEPVVGQVLADVGQGPILFATC